MHLILPLVLMFAVQGLAIPDAVEIPDGRERLALEKVILQLVNIQLRSDLAAEQARAPFNAEALVLQATTRSIIEAAAVASGVSLEKYQLNADTLSFSRIEIEIVEEDQ